MMRHKAKQKKTDAADVGDYYAGMALYAHSHARFPTTDYCNQRDQGSTDITDVSIDAITKVCTIV